MYIYLIIMDIYTSSKIATTKAHFFRVDILISRYLQRKCCIVAAIILSIDWCAQLRCARQTKTKLRKNIHALCVAYTVHL